MLKRYGGAYYDTDKCRKLYTIASDDERLVDRRLFAKPTNPRWWRETLYIKPRGELWLYCEGYGESMYAGHWGDARTGGFRIRRGMAWDDVREWLVERLGDLTGSDIMQGLMDENDNSWSSDKKTTLCIYASEKTKRQLARLARDSNISISKYISSLIYTEYRAAYRTDEDELEELGLL